MLNGYLPQIQKLLAFNAYSPFCLHGTTPLSYPLSCEISFLKKFMLRYLREGCVAFPCGRKSLGSFFYSERYTLFFYLIYI